MLKKILLNSNWDLKDEFSKINLKTDIPSSTYEILEKNNIIQNPYYGLNEKEVQWVHKKNWIFNKTFELTKEDLNNSKIELILEGIDTFSEIYLNNKLLGKTDNMFLEYKFDIKPYAQNKNDLRIIIKDSYKISKEIKGLSIKSHKFAEEGVEKIRKAAYSFGWDWGPVIIDSGIWKDIYINTYEEKIPDFYLDITLNENYEKANIKIEFEKIFENENLNYEIKIKSPDQKTISKTTKDKKLEFIISNPKLWWTKELGKPNLYEMEIKLKNENMTLDLKKFNFGIRELKLIREKDEWGESFYFKLNGINIFAKGANWIPVDNLINRGEKLNLYENLINDSIKANFNMIRVWGGGIYEIDKFYDLCDQNGLLVWQDFMFACKPQTDYEGFYENIDKEFEYNIKRLRNHPCLALWVGNNEIEEGWELWGWKYFFNRKYMKVYKEIFEKILPQKINQLDPNRQYWPSSPSSGGNFKDPNSPNKGDSHYWDVWHSGKDFKSYRNFDSRFMSEFGFESFPNLKTIKQFSEEKDFDFYSEVMENHQKNDAGNKKIFDYMKKRFKIPNNFQDKVIISQLTQAEAMQYGVEHWRRNRNDNHCMGSLYWQLNDCWPVASWSSIDYYGRWKALHYFAKRFYNPILISIKDDENQFEIWYTNDLPKIIKGNLILKISNENGEIIKSENMSIELKKLYSEKIKSYKLTQKNVIIEYEFKNDDYNYENSFIIGEPKDFNLCNPELEYELEKIETNKFLIHIKIKKPALYIQIDTKNIDFISSDNFFNMLKSKKTLEIITKKDIELNTLKKDIKIKSLYEIYDKNPSI
jgi:beta-mannosidase